MENLGIDWKILIGQIINFAILLFLLKRFAFKPFLGILEKRKRKIEEGVKKSEEAEKSLEGIRNMSREIRENGERDARKLIIEAESRAKARAEEIMAKVEAEKRKAVEDAKKIIKKEGEEEMKRREKEMVETTFVLTEKLLGEKLDEGRDKKIIEGLIADLK